MGKRLNAIISEAKSDWQMWKETENEHPGVDFRTWKSDRVKAMAQEHEELMGGQNIRYKIQMRCSGITITMSSLSVTVYFQRRIVRNMTSPLDERKMV